jgi:glycine/serine hydroxymethyltransferase
MSSSLILDLHRELEKARLALIASQSHLAAHAEANAALHCATTVMYSPLHATVTNAVQQIEQALQRSEAGIVAENTDSKLLEVLFDLDRCEHGRHAGDVCGDSCGTTSRGNPYLGEVIGYGLRADLIVVPSRENKRVPAAWRRPRDTETETSA